VVTVGVVLLVAAVLLGVDIVLENPGTTEIMIMGQLLSFDVWGLFVLGIATGVLVVLGVQVLAQGLVWDRRKVKASSQVPRGQASGPGVVPATVPQPTLQPSAPVAEPPDSPTVPQASAPPRVEDLSQPRPGPFDRVVARVADIRKPDKPDKPDKPTVSR
jgi:hypothetical protein